MHSNLRGIAYDIVARIRQFLITRETTDNTIVRRMQFYVCVFFLSHHHHRGHAPDWSVAVSTSCFHRSRS